MLQHMYTHNNHYVNHIVHGCQCNCSFSSERTLYSFECSFHTLFNYTQANCRLDYTMAENRYRCSRVMANSSIAVYSLGMVYSIFTIHCMVYVCTCTCLYVEKTTFTFTFYIHAKRTHHTVVVCVQVILSRPVSSPELCQQKRYVNRLYV